MSEVYIALRSELPIEDSELSFSNVITYMDLPSHPLSSNTLPPSIVHMQMRLRPLAQLSGAMSSSRVGHLRTPSRQLQLHLRLAPGGTGRKRAQVSGSQSRIGVGQELWRLRREESQSASYVYVIASADPTNMNHSWAEVSSSRNCLLRG